MVRQEFRRSLIFFPIGRAAMELCRLIYVHAQQHVVLFSKRFGASPMEPHRKLVFSDSAYTELFFKGERPSWRRR
jgi:hypothetical protein